MQQIHCRLANPEKICGVVVLYNPERQILDNIASYIGYLDKLFVVDNSEDPKAELIDALRQIPNCYYHPFGENLGIAAALNAGAKLALKEGAGWLLTMDQDSKFEGDNLKLLIDFTLQQDTGKIGVVSPYHRTKLGVLKRQEIEEVQSVMTSGNLVSIPAYVAIDGFDDSLFIDAVDWDFCLRLNMSGFKVLRLNTVFLEHNLGNASYHKGLSGKEVVVLNYNKIRRYYITRNKLFIFFKYRKDFPGYCNAIFKTLFRDLRHIVMYEQHKASKLRYFFKGIFDFVLGRKGKLL